MNSEELEQSLKAEFEGYLKDVLAKMRDDVKEFQTKIESEFEKHRSQIDDEFRSFLDRFEIVPEVDGGFKESVIEHLRLAKDEGAKITATAFAEAEKLDSAVAPSLDLNEIKDALNDISGNDTQATILKSLIGHAEKYCPRGAFFIVKNEQFIGWRTFGKEAGDAEASIRDIVIPVSGDSILSAAVGSLGTVDGSYGTFESDSDFLEPLHFGRPDRMHAIPLVVRGRGVAVLYCDYGHEGVSVNLDAVEMLMKVASLTVEVQASARSPLPEQHHEVAEDEQDAGSVDAAGESEIATGYTFPADESNETIEDSFDSSRHAYEVPGEEAPVEVTEPDVESASTFETMRYEPLPADAFSPPPVAAPEYKPFDEDTSTDDVVVQESFDESAYVPADAVETHEETPTRIVDEETPEIADEEPAREYQFETVSPFDQEVEETDVAESTSTADKDLATERAFEAAELASLDDSDEQSPAAETVSEAGLVFEADEEPAVEEAETGSVTRDSFFETLPTFESPVNGEQPHADVPTFEPPPFDQPVSRFDVPPVAEFETSPAVPVAAEVPQARPVGRLSERNVDLPIEVPESERRLHNDARRFARLLVSEIKLYNEKKVQDGREANDLYERLREAIDRSREMYDKRVQPPVASTFDYFHYELVNSLAEGEEAKLGDAYRGAMV